METDSFFYRLFKELPQTLFELLGQPSKLARSYRFDSVELKKSLRIDGLFLPMKPKLPLYIVEVQFQLLASFYANLFAKVFCYLEENDPAQEWQAVAIFGSRSVEPRDLGPYRELLQSDRVKRIYLDEYEMPADPPPGLGIVQLVSAPKQQVERLGNQLLRRAEGELAGSEFGAAVLELTEEILIRRFSGLSREEVLAMFQLEEFRKTKVAQEIYEDGLEKGIVQGMEKGIVQGMEKGIVQGMEKGMELMKSRCVQKFVAQGMSAKKIAELLELPIEEVRRLAKTTRP